MTRPLRVFGLAGAALVGLACTGGIDAAPTGPGGNVGPGGGNPSPGGNNPGPGGGNPGPTNPNGTPVTPPGPANPQAGSLDDSATVPGAAPLRRLTNLEYRNSIRDLLGVDIEAVKTAGFTGDVDSALSGFVRGGVLTGGTDARALMTASDALAQLATQKLDKLVPCAPLPTAAGEQDTCADKFIRAFGQRAFRRPLSSDEAAALSKLYKTQRTEVGLPFDQAIGVLVSAMLQTPYFLYHWELGPNTPVRDGNLARFNSWEMASRLSYLFWASMPDDKLFEAAAGNRLVSPEQISAEARRLLADDKARDAVRDFHYQWLEIGGLGDLPKDATYTNYSPAVAVAMGKETAAFVDSVFFGPKADGKLETLLTSRTSFVDASLAKVYGLAAPAGGLMKEVTLDPAQRAGILTQGSFLAVKADPDTSHPTKRGDAVQHRMLCLDLKVPDTLEVPPVADPNPNQTTRERFEVHGSAACAQACHQYLDPIGFAFENYDAIGAYRTTENNKPINASGQFTLKSGEIKFKNAVEMVAQLAKAPETAECMVKQWLRYAMRRHEQPSEDPSLRALETTFRTSGYDMRELMVALTKTRAFTHRALSAGEVAQ
jgi:hypothetical protein